MIRNGGIRCGKIAHARAQFDFIDVGRFTCEHCEKEFLVTQLSSIVDLHNS